VPASPNRQLLGPGGDEPDLLLGKRPVHTFGHLPADARRDGRGIRKVTGSGLAGGSRLETELVVIVEVFPGADLLARAADLEPSADTKPITQTPAILLVIALTTRP